MISVSLDLEAFIYSSDGFVVLSGMVLESLPSETKLHINFILDCYQVTQLDNNLRYTSFAFLMTFTDSYRFLDADYRSDNQISVSHKVFEKFAIDSVMGLCYLLA